VQHVRKLNRITHEAKKDTTQLSKREKLVW